MSLVTARDNGTLGITQRATQPDSFARSYHTRTADRARNVYPPNAGGEARAAVREPAGLEILHVALGRVRHGWCSYRTRHREVLWRIGTGGMTVFYCVLIIALSTWIARLTGELKAERQRADETAKLLLEVMESPR